MTEFGYNMLAIHNAYLRAKNEGTEAKFKKMLAPFSEYNMPRGVTVDDVAEMDK